MLARQALGEALAGSFAEAASEAYFATAAILLNSGDAAAARSTLEQAIEYCEASGRGNAAVLRRLSCARPLEERRVGPRRRALPRRVAVPDALGFSHGHAAMAWGCVEAARGRAGRRYRCSPRPCNSSPPWAARRRESAAAFGRLEAGAETSMPRRIAAGACSRFSRTFETRARRAAALGCLAPRVSGRRPETAACGEAIARIAADYPHVEARAALAATLGESALLAATPSLQSSTSRMRRAVRRDRGAVRASRDARARCGRFRRSG